ncbi:bifunctional adenosylcobinamide kinase/adenosylcobinamide-phosphate guanylyltransferase [Budviciaceae bacterium CWB-B4]|uniref:Bifunctional adenosylcobalamin biosynthesis protein n=1 Tax=Limnobaculum xujianqingii TaxID=2738837 RepID=A0A9D7AH65_9GAMM|nr:bifunctional adenosylcobinamide kinase/adenosylcobinamide-phosphate guanylyltransferase [Limnobaculum xujianqingii]MBK5072633.1 bifunctional adenosylcobinamide kinase/adenosylcobinamide-phosphate guanylyltransferase [Limnobaculum xujianqingii]MBK5175942.1 bifunctional adenosylcobinamide kinase/adenosylcobinamide-phosphate guanylyltransferase [Limnobaculum xujianqingii]
MILITGGARSGKSHLAERIANQKAATCEGKVLYIATSLATDDEMSRRIEQHKLTRPAQWRTHEGYRQLGNEIRQQSAFFAVVVLECITTMLTNLIFDWAGDNDPDYLDYLALERWLEPQIDDLLKACAGSQSEIIIVTNELGCGIVPEYPLARHFLDIAGRVNQKLAQQANEVHLVVSGIDVKIKG